jgi:hypothetical protein
MTGDPEDAALQEFAGPLPSSARSFSFIVDGGGASGLGFCTIAGCEIVAERKAASSRQWLGAEHKGHTETKCMLLKMTRRASVPSGTFFLHARPQFLLQMQPLAQEE